MKEWKTKTREEKRICQPDGTDMIQDKMEFVENMG